MLIHCPECHFDRQVAIESIPPTAVNVTCPRCKHRFRFRELPEDANAQTNEVQTLVEGNEGQTPLQETKNLVSELETDDKSNNENFHENLPQHEGDDPLPPNAQIFTQESEKIDTKESPEKEEQKSPLLSKIESSKEAKSNELPKNKEEAPKKASFFDGLMKNVQEKISEAKQQKNTLKDEEIQANTKDNSSPVYTNTSNTEEDNLNDEAIIPWEAPEKYGYVQAFIQTVLMVMFSPAAFFGQLRYALAPLLRPIIFFMLLGIFQSLVEYLWYSVSMGMLAQNAVDPQVQSLIDSLNSQISLPMTLLMSPIKLAMQLAFLTGIMYLMIRLVQPERAHLSIIARIICYSAAPTLICIVPFLGPLVGTIWFAVVCFIGCKHALDLTWQRTVMALGPLYFVSFAISLHMARQLLM